MTDLEARLEKIRLCTPLLPPPEDRVVDQRVRALVEAMKSRYDGRTQSEIKARILAILDGKEEA